MKQEIISSLLDADAIKKEIKDVTDSLKTLQANLVTAGSVFKDAFSEAINTLKEIKSTTNFAELNTTVKRMQKEIDELNKTNQEQKKQTDELIKQQERLVALGTQQAVAIQKTRIQVAQKTKEVKAEAQAQLAAEKAMQGYDSILKMSTKSINDYTMQNEQLRRVVETLNLNTQADEIKRLNSIIDTNTAIIKANKDAYVQQKMDVGNYGIVVNGLKDRFNEITQSMQRLEAQGKTQGAEYLALKQQLGITVAEMDKMANTINGLGNETISLRTKLKAMRDELAPLEDAMQNGTATEAMKKRYMELSVQAARMQDTMGDVQERIRAMASDTFVFDALGQSVQLCVAGFQAWKGTMTLLGVESEEFEKIIKSLMAAQALSNSLSQISKSLQSNSIIMTYLQIKAETGNTVAKWAAVAAQRALNAAQKAMPFLLFGTLLAGIGKMFFDMAKSTKEASEEQKTINELQEKGVEIAKAEGAELSKLVATASTYAKGTKERANAINEINTKYGNYLPNLLKENASVGDLRKAYEELQPVLVQQAIVRASLEKIGEKGGLLTDNLLKQKNIQQQMADIEEKMAEERRKNGDDLYRQTQGFMGSIDTQFTTLHKLSNEYKLLGGDLSELQTEYAKTDKEIMLINSVSADAANQIAKSYKGSADAANEGSKMHEEQLKIEEQLWKDLTKEVEAYIKSLDDKKATGDKGELADRLKKEIAAVEQQTKSSVGAITSIGDAAKMGQEQSMAALSESYKRGEISAQEYQKKLQQIQDASSRGMMESQIAYVEEELKAANLPYETKLALEQELFKLKRDLRNQDIKETDEVAKKEIEIRKKASEMANDFAKQAFEMTMDFLVQQQEARIADIDAQIQEVEDWKTRELEKLDESVMSEETRAAETKRINEQAEADREKLEAEKRKEQQKQAIFEKAQAVAQAAINTALSITASAQMGFPLAIPFIAMAAALGAIQTAMIIAQPLPKYAKGAGVNGQPDHRGGLAIVGDGGKREYALTPSGKMFETPAMPTLIDLPKHTQVFPDYSSMMDYFRPEVPVYAKGPTTAPDFTEGIERIEKAVQQIKPVQHVSMNLDSNGIWYVSNGKSWKGKYVNNRLNHKL